MLMIRLLLVLLIIFLIARAFFIYGSDSENDAVKPDSKSKKSKPQKGVPKGIGEYIDYEEVKKSK